MFPPLCTCAVVRYPINKDGSAKIVVIKKIVIIAKIVLDIDEPPNSPQLEPVYQATEHQGYKIVIYRVKRDNQ
jgi:hypothetical protein